MKSARSAPKSAPNARRRTARRWKQPTRRRKRRPVLSRPRAEKKRSSSLRSQIYREKIFRKHIGRPFRTPFVLPWPARLLSERPAHRTNVAGFVIEHCQPKFLATGRNLHVNLYHHSVIYNLLIVCRLQRSVHFNAVGPQILAVRAPDSCVEAHIHLLAAAGIFRRQGVGIHQENDPNFSWVSGLGLRHE